MAVASSSSLLTQFWCSLGNELLNHLPPFCQDPFSSTVCNISCMDHWYSLLLKMWMYLSIHLSVCLSVYLSITIFRCYTGHWFLVAFCNICWFTVSSDVNLWIDRYVWISPGAWISVLCECCMLTGRGLCVGMITCPEESYQVWCA
jgi:hypothetical protein